MATIKPPLVFIDRAGEVSTFDTVREAEGQLEAIDVESGEYRGFDSDGCPLRLTYEGLGNLRSGSVGIHAESEAEPRPDEVKVLIIEHAVRYGADQSALDGLDLLNLIAFVRS